MKMCRCSPYNKLFLHVHCIHYASDILFSWCHTSHFFDREWFCSCVYLPSSPQCTCWSYRAKLCYLLCCAFISVIRVWFPSVHTWSYTLRSLGGSSVQLKTGFSAFFSPFAQNSAAFPPKLWRKPNGYLFITSALRFCYSLNKSTQH